MGRHVSKTTVCITEKFDVLEKLPMASLVGMTYLTSRQMAQGAQLRGWPLLLRVCRVTVFAIFLLLL